jgi:hypothetical protein
MDTNHIAATPSTFSTDLAQAESALVAAGFTFTEVAHCPAMDCLDCGDGDWSALRRAA